MTDDVNHQVSDEPETPCPGCEAARSRRPNLCLAHDIDPWRVRRLERWREGEETLLVVSVVVDGGLLREIVEWAPRDKDGVPQLRNIDFRAATFTDDVSLRGLTFGDAIRFDNATFADGTRFDGATFGHSARFDDATLGHTVRFNDATFGKGASFRDAKFGADVRFNDATFGRFATFIAAKFDDGAQFKGATFGDDARFDDAKFGKDAVFDDVTLGAAGWFNRVTFFDGVRFARGTFGFLASFEEATFRGGAAFGDVTFGDVPLFSGATSASSASFADATFCDSASFEGATFRGPIEFKATFRASASFERATFSDFASFELATFHEGPNFQRATFSDWASFARATLSDFACFDDATFGNYASFEEAKFGDHATFVAATFGNYASFEGSTFSDIAIFMEAIFATGSQLGPIQVAPGRRTGTGVLDMRASGLHRSVVVAAANEIWASGMGLSGNCQLRSSAKIDLSDADCSSPTILAPLSTRDAERLGKTWAHQPPRLLSLRGADVAGLSCTDVDLSNCRFAGAHHLDALRIDGTSRFDKTPKSLWWPLLQWRWSQWRIRIEEAAWRAAHHLDAQRIDSPARFAAPPLPNERRPSHLQWWTHRQVLVEEAVWRAGKKRANGRSQWPGWRPPDTRLASGGWQPPDMRLASGGEMITPAHLSGLYRALRKSREDAKDEPGAADFYYGEMEMRRHDPDRTWHERSIVRAYWALSGYGLRASRAFIALAVVIAVGVLALWAVGLEPSAAQSVGFADVALYAAANATPVGSNRLRTLSTEGEAIRIFLRLAGPVLLGFALLALRGRVKR